MRRSTFRTVALAASLPLAIAVLGVFLVLWLMEARLRAEADARLSSELAGYAALYEQRRIPALREAMEFRALREDGTVFLLMDKAGAPLAGNLDAWPEPPSGAQEIGTASYLLGAQTLRGGFPMVVGVPLEPMQTTLAQMRRVFAGFGLAMLAAALGTAALVARAARRRIKRLNTFLSGLGGKSGISARYVPEPDAPEEHAKLSAEINRMLDRISQLFDAHRRLGNAVAHEMRTPLARIQSKLRVLDVEEGDRLGLEEEIRATIRLFDGLLSIAEMDAEGGNTDGLAPVDLSEIARGIEELYRPVVEDSGRRLTARLGSDAMILGDASLLAQLLSNLIENGVKYTREGDAIMLNVTRAGGSVFLEVADTGPGLEPDLKARLFEPFTRGSGTAALPGHGLGLSLVRAIALRHGAVPRLGESDKGFALRVEFLHVSARGDV